MRTVVVKYREEGDGTWIGSSADVPGYVGHGESFKQARERISEGLPWFAEEDLAIAHVIPDTAEGSFKPTAGQKVRFELTKAPTPQFQALPPKVSGVASG